MSVFARVCVFVCVRGSLCVRSYSGKIIYVYILSVNYIATKSRTCLCVLIFAYTIVLYELWIQQKENDFVNEKKLEVEVLKSECVCVCVCVKVMCHTHISMLYIHKTYTE